MACKVVDRREPQLDCPVTTLCQEGHGRVSRECLGLRCRQLVGRQAGIFLDLSCFQLSEMTPSLDSHQMNRRESWRWTAESPHSGPLALSVGGAQWHSSRCPPGRGDPPAAGCLGPSPGFGRLSFKASDHSHVLILHPTVKRVDQVLNGNNCQVPVLAPLSPVQSEVFSIDFHNFLLHVTQK